MTKIRIEHEGITCEITEDVVMLHEVLDMCRRAINGVGYGCGQLREVEEFPED